MQYWNKNEYRTLVEWYWQGKTEVLEKKMYIFSVFRLDTWTLNLKAGCLSKTLAALHIHTDHHIPVKHKVKTHKNNQATDKNEVQLSLYKYFSNKPTLLQSQSLISIIMCSTWMNVISIAGRKWGCNSWASWDFLLDYIFKGLFSLHFAYRKWNVHGLNWWFGL